MKMIRAAVCAALLAALASASLTPANLAAQTAAQPAPLRVFAAAALTTVFTSLDPQCQRAAGRPLAINYGTSVAIKQSVEAGDALDMVILASDPTDALEKEGKFLPGTRVNFARAAVAIAARVGAPKPDIATADGMKRTLLAAKAIAYVKDGAAAPLVLKMADRLGVADQVKAKTVTATNSADAAALVVDGKADLFFNLVSEILPVKTIKLAGPIPAQFDRYIVYSAAIPANSANAKSAAALIHFLASPAVAPMLKAKGLERVSK